MESTMGELLAGFSERQGIPVNSKFGGSLSAIQAIRSGDCDIALVADPYGSISRQEDLVVIPFCFSVAYIVVHTENPLRDVSLDQLRSIYIERGDFKARNWGDLNLPRDWMDSPVIPVLIDDQSSIVKDYFLYILRTDAQNLDQNTVRLKSASDVVHYLLEDRNALAVIDRPVTLSGCKILPVLLNREERSVYPSEINIFSGSYSLRVPYCLLLGKQVDDNTKSLALQLLSPEVMTLLGEKGFSGIPPKDLSRLRLNVEMIP